MKTKFTLFVILIFTIACSPDVSGLFDMEIGDETFFSPSVWIQGVWVDEYFNINDTTVSEGSKFSKNDFIIKYEYGSGESYNERINILSTKYLSCKELITTTNYQITILHLSTNRDIYDFYKISDTEIGCRYESGVVDDWSNRIIEDYTLFKN